jgi:transmembrane sensor
MDLSNYAVKDFVLDESFQKWILEPDVESKIFWEDWLNAHPDKIELITEARSTIQFMREIHEKDLARERDQVWNMISESIQDLEREAIIKKTKEIENTR